MRNRDTAEVKKIIAELSRELNLNADLDTLKSPSTGISRWTAQMILMKLENLIQDPVEVKINDIVRVYCGDYDSDRFYECSVNSVENDIVCFFELHCESETEALVTADKLFMQDSAICCDHRDLYWRRKECL